MPAKQDQVLLIALGGNALIRKGQTGTIEEQFANLKKPLSQAARLSRRHRVIITHGNGPQVGRLMLQQEESTQTDRQPLEILVAQTQGQIGYMIESTLDAELMDLGVVTAQPLITVLTYVVVDERDPGFADPTKPIGPAFTREEAAKLPYPTMETPKGWRRVVASPRPKTVVEKREIAKLIEAGFLVICCGGGGIPVIREGRRFNGVDAVIDKDLVSAVLAAEVGVDAFIIATDAPGVMDKFGTPEEKLIRRLTVAQAQAGLASGLFPAGSMGPKVEAAVRFAKSGRGRAIITSIEDIESALDGQAGTEVVP